MKRVGSIRGGSEEEKNQSRRRVAVLMEGVGVIFQDEMLIVVKVFREKEKSNVRDAGFSEGR